MKLIFLTVLLLLITGMSVIALNAPPDPGTMPPTVQCVVAGDSCATTTSAGAVSSTCCPGLQCQNGVCTEHKGFFTRVLNFFGIEPGRGTTNGESQEPNGQGTDEQDTGNAPEPQGSLPGQPNGAQPPTGPPGTAPGGSGTASSPQGTTTPDYSCCRVTVCGQGAAEYICPPGQLCGQDCRTITCQQQDYCEYDGQRYKYGEQFKQDCNVCVCNENGRVVCTERACTQCDEDVQTCYPPTTATAAPQSATPVRCEGSYEDCVAKYGKCDCGVTASAQTTVTTQTNTQVKTCVYNGAEYKEGESFPDTDGCNTCSCTNGQVRCTTRACQADTVVTAAICTYNGATYKEGESFPDTDGCNTCTCSNGRIICTERPCQADCEEKVNTCYGATSATPIKCEGTYDECTKTYDKCDCGYTETTTSVNTKPWMTPPLPPVKG